MRRTWPAVVALTVGVIAMLIVWFGVGDRSANTHPAHASAPAAVVASASAADPDAADAAATGSAAAASVDEHAAHAAGAGSQTGGHTGQPTAGPSSDPALVAVAAADPDAGAADRPQVGLAQAAGGSVGPAPSPQDLLPPPRDRWLDPGSAGVNEGTKRQAAAVGMAPAPVVDPTEVLPAHGLANGCVAGYGRGTACLPQTPPSHAGHGTGQDMSMYWTCAEARTLLPDGIVVDSSGADPLGLDADRDGTACGPGDR